VTEIGGGAGKGLEAVEEERLKEVKEMKLQDGGINENSRD
ncbi:hypothetical protein Tco_0668146, partial [Tanacetum coccineum]